jgi:hypothetical protein
MMAEDSRYPADICLAQNRDDRFQESAAAVGEQGLVLPHAGGLSGGKYESGNHWNTRPE